MITLSILISIVAICLAIEQPSILGGVPRRVGGAPARTPRCLFVIFKVRPFFENFAIFNFWPRWLAMTRRAHIPRIWGCPVELGDHSQPIFNFRRWREKNLPWWGTSMGLGWVGNRGLAHLQNLGK